MIQSVRLQAYGKQFGVRSLVKFAVLCANVDWPQRADLSNNAHLVEMSVLKFCRI